MPIHETISRAAARALEIELFTLESEDKNAVRIATQQARVRADRLASAMWRLGIKRFTAWWTTRRLAVGLQLRLYVEAIAFSIGGEFAEVVTGFKPLRVPLSAANRSHTPLPKSKRHREGE